jgi:hypothetical protein
MLCISGIHWSLLFVVMELFDSVWKFTVNRREASCRWSTLQQEVECDAKLIGRIVRVSSAGFVFTVVVE